jgi:hypothetical protein
MLLVTPFSAASLQPCGFAFPMDASTDRHTCTTCACQCSAQINLLSKRTARSGSFQMEPIEDAIFVG